MEKDVILAVGPMLVVILFLWTRISSVGDQVARLERKVDALLRHEGIELGSPGAALPAIRDALARGDKIGAIRLYREATGAGLKESKEYVDSLRI